MSCDSDTVTNRTQRTYLTYIAESTCIAPLGIMSLLCVLIWAFAHN